MLTFFKKQNQHQHYLQLGFPILMQKFQEACSPHVLMDWRLEATQAVSTLHLPLSFSQELSLLKTPS